MDTTEAYRAIRAAMTELAAGADGSAPVPACPDWTVRDLLAHVTGVAADLVAGRLDGVGTDPWTAAQVASRTDRSLAEVVAEWNEVAPAMEEAFVAFGGLPDQLVFDTTTHEHDLRGAVGATGAHRAGQVEIALRWAADAWAAGPAPAAGPLRLVAGDVEVVLGTGAPVATVRADGLEALRALTGRRSWEQVAALDWDAAADPWRPCFTWGPFTPRASALHEG
jgi:uncharacterized protein (TIGR03083 family)